MPDSAGKRQRREVKARKAAASEERRLARNQRRADRANGLIDEDPLDGTALGEPEAGERGEPPELSEADQERSTESGDVL
jgi:hypothetical protein